MKKKITIASVGRFPINRLVTSLDKSELLESYITNHPEFFLDTWSAATKIKSHALNGFLAWIIYSYFPKNFAPNLFDYIVKFIHINFGNFVKKKFIGEGILLIQSSFAKEIFKDENSNRGICIVLDHGSLHLKDDKNLALESVDDNAENLKSINLPSQWIIDRESIEFERASWIVVPSGIAKKSLVKNGVPDHKILINHLGVDTESFYPAHKKDKIFRILQVGQISERKGIFLAIKAFLKLEIENSRITFVGSHQYPTNKMYKYLMEGSERIKLLNSVSESDLVNFYGDADVLIMPSYADGFGMVVLQAMACGLPVIVSDMVGASEIIAHDEDGYIFSSGNLDELVKYLLVLYKNPEKRMKMGIAASEKVRNKFTWKQYCDRYMKILININN